MNARILAATTGRILRQLRHDRRTIALLVVVPAVLLTLVYFMYADQPTPPGQPTTFDRIALVMLGIFPFVIMFLVTSIAMLRERTSGTLERLLTTPLGKLDLLFGYGIAFGLAAAVQAAVAAAVAYWIFDLETAGSIGLVLGIAVSTPCSASPSGCCAVPSRAPSSRQYSSCQSWWSPNCCSVGCSWPATRWPAGSRRSVTPSPCRTPSRRCRRSAPTPNRPAGCGATSLWCSALWCWRWCSRRPPCAGAAADRRRRGRRPARQPTPA